MLVHTHRAFVAPRHRSASPRLSLRGAAARKQSTWTPSGEKHSKIASRSRGKRGSDRTPPTRKSYSARKPTPQCPNPARRRYSFRSAKFRRRDAPRVNPPHPHVVLGLNVPFYFRSVTSHAL